MGTMILLTILFNVLAGACNGLMDICAGPFSSSRISHWNAQYWEKFGKGQSWRNKWHLRNENAGIRSYWTIKGYRLTIPAAFTDGWHLSKLGWRIFDALSFIPALLAVSGEIDTVNRIYWAIGIVAGSYLSEFLGFSLIWEVLKKK